MKPKIKQKDGRHFAIFEIDKNTAIKYSNKLETTKFDIICIDERNKSYEQLKLYWSILTEFVIFLFDDKLPKQEMEKIKEALYTEYQEAKGINISLSRSSVTDARLFINWIIKEFADKYNFVPKSIELQDEFNTSYAYATLVSNECIICGKQAVPIKKGRGYASLCEEHKELKAKELQNDYHVAIIPMAENTIEMLKG